MAIEFRRIDESNIDRLSVLFAAYAGSALHREGILRSARSLPAWSVWKQEEPVGFYYTLKFAPDILKLTHIFVVNTDRGRGIGTAMLAHLFDVMPDPFTAVIAANSTLFQTTEVKRDPECFYLKNGFNVIAGTANTKTYWKAKH